MAKDIIEIEWTPYQVMPSGNPIQFLFSTGGTHNWTYTGCEADEPILSNYDVWQLNFDADLLVAGEGFSVNGRTYLFTNCVERNSSNQILLDPDGCILLDNIIKKLESDPFIKDQFFVIKAGQTLTYCNNTNDTSSCAGSLLFLLIVSKNLDQVLNVQFVNDTSGGLISVTNVCPGADNSLKNYKLRSCILVEDFCHNSNKFIQAGELIAPPLPLDQTFTADVTSNLEVYRQFIFDIQQVLKPFVFEDVPDINIPSCQFAVNSIKQFKVLYGDTWENPDIEDSSLVEAGVYRVLNAYQYLYNSYYHTYFEIGSGLGNACFTENTQPYLLKPFFEDDKLRFLTNTQNKVLKQDNSRFEYLYFWIKSGVNTDYLKGYFDLVYCDGTSKKGVSDYFFSIVNCPGCSTKTDEQILMIPLNRIIDQLSGGLDNVCNFCFYLTAPDCSVAANKGSFDVTFAQGGELLAIESLCIDLDFSAYGCDNPTGSTGTELASSVINILDTCANQALQDFINTQELEYSQNGNTLTFTFNNQINCDDSNLAEFIWTFDESPNYVFNDPIYEKGFYITFGNIDCNNCLLPCIPDNFKFSNATSWENYLDNVILKLTDIFTNQYNSTIVEERQVNAQGQIFVSYKALVNISYIQSVYGVDICDVGFNLCVFQSNSKNNVFEQNERAIKHQIIENVRCCTGKCCDETVTVTYTGAADPLVGKYQFNLEFQPDAVGDLAIIRLDNSPSPPITLFDFVNDTNACYNTYLTGHVNDPAAMAQGLIDFGANCVDPNWTNYVATYNVVLLLVSPTVVRWEQDYLTTEICDLTIVGNNIVDGLVTNRAELNCFTFPPLHYTTKVVCCDGTEPEIQISEKIQYQVEEGCEDGTAFMFNNQYGMNEIIYLPGSYIEFTNTVKQSYEKDIKNNLSINHTNKEDRTTTNITSDGYDSFTLQTNLFGKEHLKQTLKEMLQSNNVRLLYKSLTRIDCGDDCPEEVYIESFIPIQFITDELQVFNSIENNTEFELEFRKSNSNNAL